MLINKTKPGWEFLLPLATHCSVHGFLTLSIVMLVNPHLWWLAIVDFFAHFFMDRIKAGPKYLGRYRDTNKAPFWISLGFDQMVHHLTGIYIVWVIATHPLV